MELGCAEGLEVDGGKGGGIGEWSPFALGGNGGAASRVGGRGGAAERTGGGGGFEGAREPSKGGGTAYLDGGVRSSSSSGVFGGRGGGGGPGFATLE